MNRMNGYRLAACIGGIIATSSIYQGSKNFEETHNIGVELKSDCYGLERLARMSPAQRDSLVERGQELVSRRYSLESSQSYRSEVESVDDSYLFDFLLGGLAMTFVAAYLAHRESLKNKDCGYWG